MLRKVRPGTPSPGAARRPLPQGGEGRGPFRASRVSRSDMTTNTWPHEGHSIFDRAAFASGFADKAQSFEKQETLSYLSIPGFVAPATPRPFGV